MSTNGSTIKIRWDSFHLSGLRSNVTFPMKPSLMLFKCQAIKSFALGQMRTYPLVHRFAMTLTTVCHTTDWHFLCLLCMTLSLTRDFVLPITVSQIPGSEQGIYVYWLLCWIKKPKFRFQVPWLVRKWNAFVLGGFWWFSDLALWGKFWMLILKWARPTERCVGRQGIAWHSTETSQVLLGVPVPPACSPGVTLYPLSPNPHPVSEPCH